MTSRVDARGASRAHVAAPAHPDPTPASLRLLVAIADHGGLSAAARSVGMAQSNASRALAALERRLGYALVTRRTTGSTLTHEGVLAVEWARDAVEAIDRFSVGAAALGDAASELVVGASMTIAEYLAPGWLATLRRASPDLTTSLRIDNSAAIIEAVRRGACPVGFVETPQIPADLRRAPIGADRLLVVIAPDHPWSERRGGVTLAELARTPLVEREAGSGTRAFLDLAVERAGLPLPRARPIAELTSNSAIAASAVAGLGPAVLSVHAVRGALRDGRLLAVPVADGPIERSLHAIWLGAAHPVGGAERLIAIATGSLRDEPVDAAQP